MENTLISTLYSLEPVITCITLFSPKKVVILREENPPEKKIETERMLNETVGRVLEIETKITSIHDLVQIAKDTAEIIENENSYGRNIVVNISGGRKPQALGTLFGSYARHMMIEKIVYISEEDGNVLDLPILNFGLSKTKLMILEELQKGENSVKELAARIGISRGMTYNHLRELREMGFIDQKILEITSAGELAII